MWKGPRIQHPHHPPPTHKTQPLAPSTQQSRNDDRCICGRFRRQIHDDTTIHTTRPHPLTCCVSYPRARVTNEQTDTHNTHTRHGLLRLGYATLAVSTLRAQTYITPYHTTTQTNGRGALSAGLEGVEGCGRASNPRLRKFTTRTYEDTPHTRALTQRADLLRWCTHPHTHIKTACNPQVSQIYLERKRGSAHWRQR